MLNSFNLDAWLVEADLPPLGGQPSVADPNARPPQPNAANMPGPGMGMENPDPNQRPTPNQEDDVTNDPHAPDMPEKVGGDEDEDFEIWRQRYIKELLKGDSNTMIDLIHQVRDRELSPNGRRFVEDNLQIQFLRQDSNIASVSKEIIKNIKQEINKNTPGVSITNHIALALEANPVITGIYLKFNGLWGSKQDYHRKFVASLLNAVQVGSGGGDNEDIVYNDVQFAARISTRYNRDFGNVMLGNWSLREDDPERHLKEPELKRLEDGSPEEKDVLYRRLVLESIVQVYLKRAFLINVAVSNGTIYHLGMDIAELLKSSYKDGKLIVRTRRSENSEAMLGDDGEIIPYEDLFIRYTKPTGRQDAEGKPEMDEMDFMERKNGQLYLTASLATLKDATTTLAGLVLKEMPYNGNQSEIRVLERCVPSVAEILLRRC